MMHYSAGESGSLMSSVALQQLGGFNPGILDFYAQPVN